MDSDVAVDEGRESCGRPMGQSEEPGVMVAVECPEEKDKASGFTRDIQRDGGREVSSARRKEGSGQREEESTPI